MCFSVQPRDRMFVKGYGVLPFAKNMSKHRDKNIIKNLGGKCRQNLLDHTKQFATDALEAFLKIAI